MSGLFRKTYFQTKVKKSGRCHNLKPGWAPQGNFLCNLSPSFYLNIMFTLTTWQNSHMEALYLWKNLCSWKFESRKKSLGRKKNRPKEERRVPFCQEKKKILGNKTTGTLLHTGIQISNKSPWNQNLLYIKFNTRFLFIYASTSHDMNTSTIA